MISLGLRLKGDAAEGNTRSRVSAEMGQIDRRRWRRGGAALPPRLRCTRGLDNQPSIDGYHRSPLRACKNGTLPDRRKELSAKGGDLLLPLRGRGVRIEGDLAVGQ